MQEQLRRALDLLLHDLATGGPTPDVRDVPWVQPPVASAHLVAEDGSALGVSLPVDADPVEQLVHLADQVQDWAVEALRYRRRPATWPQCPHHRDTHPLTARLREGRAVWTCPATGAVVAAVGSLT